MLQNMCHLVRSKDLFYMAFTLSMELIVKTEMSGIDVMVIILIDPLEYTMSSLTLVKLPLVFIVS